MKMNMAIGVSKLEGDLQRLQKAIEWINSDILAKEKGYPIL